MKQVITKRFIGCATLTTAFLLHVCCIGNATAEIRTISATGEYRMGANDTRTDAKRLALLDAKRLALEQAGVYIESITEVKTFDLTKEEIRAYTAGIVEVIEQKTRTVMEGDSTVIRVDATAKIDTDVVTRQIEALRKNDSMKAELTRLRAEGEQLQREVEIRTRELTALRSKAEVHLVTQQRQALIAQTMVNELLRNAEAATWDFRSSRIHNLMENKPAYDKQSVDALARARSYTEQALVLNPHNVRTKEIMAEILSFEGDILADRGELKPAASKFRSAINLQPNHAWYHSELASVLLRMGEIESALTEARTAQHLKPNDDVYSFLVGMVLAFSGDVNGAVTIFRNRGCPSGTHEPSARHYCAGLALKTLMDEVAEAPTMMAVREKFPRGKIKEIATKEFKEYLRLAPNTRENHEMIMDAQAQVLELDM
jgi:tetratricopeptide (TPR) repeat protein